MISRKLLMDMEAISGIILLGVVGYLLFFTSFHWMYRVLFSLSGLVLLVHSLKLGRDIFEREIRDD